MPWTYAVDLSHCMSLIDDLSLCHVTILNLNGCLYLSSYKDQQS